MLQKEYNIKIYSLAGVFQRVLPGKLLMSGVSFSETINGGQGELRIKLNLPITSTLVQYNQIIKVFESDKDNEARCIFTGIVGNLRRASEGGETYIEVRAVGLASILTWVYFKNAWNYAFSRTQAAHLTMKEVIDYFDTLYPGIITYTWTSVEVAGGTSSVEFDYTKCFVALSNIQQVADRYWWAIDGSGILQFHPLVWSAYAVTHTVTMGVQVEKLVVDESVEKLVNKYILLHNAGIYVADDATSISANGLRELKEDKTPIISDAPTATVAGDTYVANNKDYRRKIQVKINDQYDIESIHAGHFLTINNSEYSVSSLQIQKIQYNMDNVELELEEITSLAKEIFT